MNPYQVILWVSSALALLAIGGRPAHGASPEIVLVQDGRSRFVIVHAAGAPASVVTAAQELQRYVEKSTQGKLPIVAGEAPATSPFISLGDTPAARAAGITTRDVPLEGYRLVGRGESLHHRTRHRGK